MSDAFDAAFGGDAGFADGGGAAGVGVAGVGGAGVGAGVVVAGSGSRDEDPAAAFLAQQESEMAGIEGIEDMEGGGSEGAEGFSILDAGDEKTFVGGGGGGGDDFDLGLSGDFSGADMYRDANGPPTAPPRSEFLPPAQEPESLRRWRQEQRERLEQLDAASRKAEAEWRDRAKKELDEWKARQGEQLEKTRRNNRAAEDACVRERDEEAPGSEWERVARLCDFNPKTSKQSKDVSRMRGIIIALKQSPLVR